MVKINLRSGSLGLNIVGGLLTAGALLSFIRTNDSTKPFALNILIASATLTATNCFLSKHYEETANRQLLEILKVSELTINNLDNDSNRKDSIIKELQQLYDSRGNEIQQANSDVSQLSEALKIQNAQFLLAKQELEAVKRSLTSQLEQLQQQHENHLTDLKTAIFDEINIRLCDICNQLSENIKTKLKSEKYININSQLVKYQKDLVKTHEECVWQIEYLRDLESSDLVTVVEIYSEVYLKLINLKVKYRGLLNTHERLVIIQANEYIQQLQADSVPKEKALHIVRDQNKTSNQQLENLYSSLDVHADDINGLRNQVQDLLNQIEAKNLEIANLKKPYKWHLATREDLRVGNIIIAYFEQMGLILDRAKTDYEVWQATLSFHIDRNSRILTPAELNPHSEKLQQLCHTLSPITFKWNADEGLLTAYLHLARKPAKQAAGTVDINKLWKTADKFPDLVKNWARVRITGGSESGKSPTVENLAVCILQHKKGIVKLYNPQHESLKNFWTIPASGTSHQDSAEAIADLAAMVNNKTNERNQFQLWIFDEIDSTMTNDEVNAKAVSGNIKSILKQASHQNLGFVCSGQNANTKQYKDFDRSDWNSAVNIHIGDNAYDAINNSNAITPKEQERLKGIADQLKEHCLNLNEEIGLDKFNPQAYRFALVMEPGIKPYFIQLPDFGLYTYDQLQSVACPKCGSTNSNSHGQGRRKCKDCGYVGNF
jgi:ribosomal protein S27AE